MPDQEASSLTVLLIDDNAFSRKLTRTMLIQTGLHEVVEAGSGEEGIRIAEKVKPDLVLVDWVMPGMNGAATIRGLKALATHGYDPAVMVTSTVAVRAAIVEAARLGALAFVVKPFAMATLKTRLERVISMAGLGELPQTGHRANEHTPN